MSRSWLSLVCLLAVFAFAGSAWAGATGSPFDAGVCPAIDATTNMGNPTTTGFTNAASMKACVALCDRAGNLCKAFAKRATSCSVAWAGTNLSFARADCLIITSTPADLKTCNQNAAAFHESQVMDMKNSLVGALANCDAWVSTCETTCAL
jgi:hypothetical protein